MKSRLFIKKVVAVVLFMSIFFGIVGVNAELSAEQNNAIAMLNYIATLTQEINSSKNSRLFMEKAYSYLINNIYPNAVDSETQNQISSLLDTMENYRMLNVKRDRIQFIYEREMAQAIKAAVPNPVNILSIVESAEPAQIALAVANATVDSIVKYMQAREEAEFKLIKDGWDLDDEESAALHNSRKNMFNYMISMVHDNDIPGELALNEDSIKELVNWKNNENIVSSIRFLESNKKIYQSYGGYWLILANNYFLNKNYDKCLEAVASYEALGTRIFRRDYEFAEIIPFAISAANEIYLASEYEAFASKYSQLLLDNTDHDNWALRYFAAQTYIGLFGKTKNTDYLKKAYDVVLDNVNYLLNEQREMNLAYINKLEQIQVPKGATKAKKEEIKKYNHMLKENRKKELVPVSEPLILNCDLLFALAKELNISESEKLNIDGMLHPKGEPVFLASALDNKYWFINEKKEENIDIEYGGTALVVPANCVTSSAEITVTIKEKDSDKEVVIKDWRIENVQRVKEGEVSSYKALFVSEEAKNYQWTENSEISIDIKPYKDIKELEPYHFEYQTDSAKKEWYDYLKVWEGHKNNWYDYAKVWEKGVNFKRVK